MVDIAVKGSVLVSAKVKVINIVVKGSMLTLAQVKVRNLRLIAHFSNVGQC